MNYNFALEKHDYSRIDKLNQLTNKETFWDDVRKFTKNIRSDHSIGRWQCLAENRYRELCIKQKNWKEFYKRIIETNGNPSTKDAEECGIPFDYWLILATNSTPNGIVKAAEKALKLMEEK